MVFEDGEVGDLLDVEREGLNGWIGRGIVVGDIGAVRPDGHDSLWGESTRRVDARGLVDADTVARLGLVDGRHEVEAGRGAGSEEYPATILETASH